MQEAGNPSMATILSAANQVLHLVGSIFEWGVRQTSLIQPFLYMQNERKLSEDFEKNFATISSAEKALIFLANFAYQKINLTEDRLQKELKIQYLS